MKKAFLFLYLIFIATGAFSQKSNPKNIDDAIKFLVKDCSDSLKRVIKVKSNDSLIYLIRPWSSKPGAYDKIGEFAPSDPNKKTKLEKYYSNLGINSGKHIDAIILISFKNYLNTGQTNHDQVILPFQKLEDKWREEDKLRYTTDSLRGAYIPKDLDDCFKQIDNFWSDSTKNGVKRMTEKDFTARAHLGFGTWMRNNWQLWAGSRLSKYFNDKGIYHPENISGIILTSYYRHLTGQAVNLDEQIKFDQNYQKAAKRPTKQMFPKGAGKLEFRTGIFYDSKNNGQGYIHVGTTSKNADIWIYDYYFGWAKITSIQLTELTKNMDNREEILIKLFNKN